MRGGTIGSHLLDLKSRSGLSLAEIARRGGYAHASAVQRFFDSDYAPARLSRKVADKLAKALVGQGTPPITEGDLLSLYSPVSGAPDDVAPQALDLDLFGRDIRVFATMSAGQTALRGHSSPFSTMLIRPGPAAELQYPPHLRRRRVYGLILSLAHLHPRHEIGELVFLEPGRPAAVHDDVAITLPVPTEEGERRVVFLARVLGYDEDAIQVELFRPTRHLTIRLDSSTEVTRILRASDLLAPIEHNTYASA